MKFLDHLNPADHKILQVINNDWPFQFLSEYSRFYQSYELEHILIVYDEGTQALMPLRFMDLKFFSPVQILFAPMRNAVELNQEEQLQFFEKLVLALYYRGGCERLMQPHPFSILAVCPSGSQFCEFGTYIIDLENQSHEQIFSKFHPKYQKAVTHSQKNGASVRTGREVVNDFFKVYKSTMLRANLSFDNLDYFKSLYNYFGDEHISCGVVYDGDEPVSGVFLIHTNYAAFLTHAGTGTNTRLYGAAKFLNFEMMKYLKERGVKRYDFVGVRLNNTNPAIEGIFRFKKGFGGDLKEGYLWKLDVLPMRAKLMDLAIRVRRLGAKSTDIIDQVTLAT